MKCRLERFFICFLPMCARRIYGSRALGESMRENTIRENEIQEIPEQRLWRAVIASTVNEWVSGPLNKKREAEQFLFHDEQDFRTVCFSAGINPEHLRNRLRKIRENNTSAALIAASRN